MDVNAVDFRHNMKGVISALERNESVDLFYRGHFKGTIIPPQLNAERMDVKTLPGFGLLADDPRPVKEVIDTLRKSRCDDLR